MLVIAVNDTNSRARTLARASGKGGQGPNY